MINRTTLIALAVVTFALLAVSSILGQDFGSGNALLWTLGDVVWLAFLGCALALVVLSATVLLRSMSRPRDRD